MGGVETVAAAVRADLAARLPSQNKKQREGLALLVATALDVRSVNLMELAAAVPRAAERLDMRYQWISRLLGNAHIDVEAVMAPYAREVLARACAGSRALVVIIDQSKVNDAHHMVMVSLRVGERALPLAWCMKKTQGAIGFREQRDALATVAALMPEGVRPTLMGDRFYGSPAYSQIERTDRLDRLILVLALALYWAVSTGMWDALENRAPAEKKPRQRTARTSPAA